MTKPAADSLPAQPPDLLRLLEAGGIAGRLAPATLQTLIAAGRVRSLPEGRTLCHRGEPIRHLHLILQGTLEIAILSADGRRSVCWYIGPGQWFGLIAAMDGKGSVHTVRAHSAARLFSIPKTPFLAAMRTDPGLADLCLAVLCERSRAIYENMAAETLYPLRARVARLLLMLMGDHGRDAREGVEIALKLTQDDMAAMLGVSRQSLNKEVRHLKDQGAISGTGGRIVLRNVPLLERMSAS